MLGRRLFYVADSDAATCNGNGIALYTGHCRCTPGYSDEGPHPGGSGFGSGNDGGGDDFELSPCYAEAMLNDADTCNANANCTFRTFTGGSVNGDDAATGFCDEKYCEDFSGFNEAACEARAECAYNNAHGECKRDYTFEQASSRCSVCLDGHRGGQCQFSDQDTCNSNGVVDHSGRCTCNAGVFGADCTIIGTAPPSEIPRTASITLPSDGDYDDDYEDAYDYNLWNYDSISGPAGGRAPTHPKSSSFDLLPQITASPATAPTSSAPTEIPTPEVACAAGFNGRVCEYR